MLCFLKLIMVTDLKYSWVTRICSSNGLGHYLTSVIVRTLLAPDPPESLLTVNYLTQCAGVSIYLGLSGVTRWLELGYSGLLVLNIGGWSKHQRRCSYHWSHCWPLLKNLIQSSITDNINWRMVTSYVSFVCISIDKNLNTSINTIKVLKNSAPCLGNLFNWRLVIFK